MIERRDSLFTMIQDRDLLDHPFFCAHYEGNDHVNLTTPLNRHDHRTLCLGAYGCWQWGVRLQRFYFDIVSKDPGVAGDFQI